MQLKVIPNWGHRVILIEIQHALGKLPGIASVVSSAPQLSQRPSGPKDGVCETAHTSLPIECGSRSASHRVPHASWRTLPKLLLYILDEINILSDNKIEFVGVNYTALCGKWNWIGYRMIPFLHDSGEHVPNPLPRRLRDNERWNPDSKACAQCGILGGAGWKGSHNTSMCVTICNGLMGTCTDTHQRTVLSTVHHIPSQFTMCDSRLQNSVTARFVPD